MKHKLNIKNKFNFKIEKYLILFIILILISISIGALLKIDNISGQDTLVNILMKYKEKSMMIYFFVCFLQPIVLPLPEAVTVMTGSLVFGRFNGAIIGFLGTILGIISMFLISRYTSQKFIKNMVSENKLEKFNQYIKKNETLIILLLFIVPILPDEIICVGTGITKINGYKFIIIAILSKLITAFTLSYSIELIKFNPLSIVIIALISISFVIIINSRIKK